MIFFRTRVFAKSTLFNLSKMAKQRKICPVCVNAIGKKHVTVPVVQKFDNQGPSGEKSPDTFLFYFQHCSSGMLY
jgi:hypothetical protein